MTAQPASGKQSHVMKSEFISLHASTAFLVTLVTPLSAEVVLSYPNSRAVWAATN